MIMKQRFVLCILITVALLLLAIPRLPFTGEGLGTVFAFAWIAFAFMVISGNLIGLLYSRKWKVDVTKATGRPRLDKEKLRRYSR